MLLGHLFQNYLDACLKPEQNKISKKTDSWIPQKIHWIWTFSVEEVYVLIDFQGDPYKHKFDN